MEARRLAPLFFTWCKHARKWGVAKKIMLHILNLGATKVLHTWLEHAEEQARNRSLAQLLSMHS